VRSVGLGRGEERDASYDRMSPVMTDGKWQRLLSNPAAIFVVLEYPLTPSPQNCPNPKDRRMYGWEDALSITHCVGNAYVH
jgi:hypothetical protein